MEKLSYKLPEFEGPLDMLLFLIAKNKLKICDIIITDLVNQYMEQMKTLREDDMDVASEFVEMASRLVYIKTVSLLPKHDEAEELQRELVGQLLEYQECKRVAGVLAAQLTFNVFVRRPAEVEQDLAYKRRHTTRELLLAYQSAAGRGRRFIPPAPEVFSGIVTHRIVSVASQIISVLRRLFKSREIRYDALFEDKRDKSDLVATFLAVLELVKGKRVRVEGSGDEATVKLMDGGGKLWKSKSSEAR